MRARLGLVLWLLTMSAIGAWFAVMSLDNEPPYEWDAAETAVTPNPAKSGQMITVRWKMRTNRICPGTSQRSLIDVESGQVVATYDATPASLSVATGDKYLSRAFMLPPRLPPKVGYQSKICFTCNVLQQVMPLCVMTPMIVFPVEQ